MPIYTVIDFANALFRRSQKLARIVPEETRHSVDGRAIFTVRTTDGARFRVEVTRMREGAA